MVFANDHERQRPIVLATVPEVADRSIAVLDETGSAVSDRAVPLGTFQHLISHVDGM